MVNTSVIIPTYNRSNLLSKCLDSLCNQSFKKFEVIVVDDGSKDNTKEIVNSFKKKLNISYICQKNKGPATARNNGMSNAKGKIIAFTDDDCVVSTDWLKEINKSFKNDDVGGVEGLTKARGKIGPFTQYINNLKGKMYVTCNIAYRKNSIKDGFDTNYPYPNREDSDLAFRILKRGGKIKFNKNMIVYHPAEKISLKSALKKKRYFHCDPYLFKKYPKMYRKYVKFPFEMFTPFFIIFTMLSFFNIYFLVAIFITGIIELLYRRWHVTFIEFFKFYPLQIIGSFVIFFSVIMGIFKYKVNPLKLLLI